MRRAAHRVGATAGNYADQMFLARDSEYRYWDSVRTFPTQSRIVLVRRRPDDQKKLKSILRGEHVEPPNDDI
jgi:hypothetical protein